MKNWKKGCESDLWGRKGRKKEQYLKKRGCRERERENWKKMGKGSSAYEYACS